MPFDLIIKGGTIVDGSGKPPYQANLGIQNGQIVEIGKCNTTAKRILPAEGAIVTPGFIDLHCHYDGQVSWDQTLSPSSLHGVTTCVMGNCGVGFAPVHKNDQERLIALMEGVEDIPGAALSEGISWGWESFSEYMNVIDSLPHSIDFLTQVPHDALRVYVMGKRATAKEEASDSDIAKMRALLFDALRNGAAGFSTGRTDNHRSAYGDPTPASEATTKELSGIVKAFHGVGHGVLQAVSDFNVSTSVSYFAKEFTILEHMVNAAKGPPLSLSLLQRNIAPEQWREVVARAEQAQKQNIPIYLQVAPRAIGVLLGLEATFHPFIGFPSYRKIAHLPLEERVRFMKRKEFRQKILTEKSEPIAGDGSSVPPLADQLLSSLETISFRLFALNTPPDYEPPLEDSLGMKSKKQGVSPLEMIYDTLLQQDGHALIYFPIYNYMDGSLDTVAEMLHQPLALLGLSDGGAHVGTICDASFPTFFLLYWARDRKKKGFSVEQAVRMLSYDIAQYLGLHDRGLLASGKKADINIIDFSKLQLPSPQLQWDLPAGGKRFFQGASGYRATIVSGEVIRENQIITKARPGKLVRLGQIGRPPSP